LLKPNFISLQLILMDGFSRDPSRARRRYGKTLHVTTQPLFASYRLSWLLVVAAPLVLANCSSNNDNNGGNGGSPGSGGATSGGATGSGGSSSGGAPGSGGAASGGATGSGGASSGGAAGSGGSSSGGASHGGSSSGGSSNGGQTGSSGGAAGGGGKSSGGAAGAAGTTGTSGATGTGGGSSGSFTLASADMMDGDKFDTKFTCNGGTIGQGLNPELHWSGAPAGTMSFAITFIDTTIGANMQMGQHWAMWNIPATVTKLPQGTTSLSGDFAMAKQSGKYLAPCAISVKNMMDDQYEFTVYALSTATLNVSGTSVANALTALGVLPNGMLASSVLGKATFHGHAGVGGK
jgi:phosphatidylethanolamine-binding protein (PEBP) family uncharacterized protein